ncbi:MULTISPECIES: aspartate-alanine antiporter [unclassified Gilliamella]|uniref:aspartate-alanine antiporter n=1 Tax=unclassified Gilliamella TaxID=2685620 RepID=UPI00226A8A63|nr:MULTISPECIES: aspartate-alanine antiporter [unclassified Gilliamella]MCX8642211.1 aspartate-alanine antiporter [Gilliamella sp. B3835]MCX8707397.1 aspartate-alanine antiporter [Gilliamella sp. B3783]MCX8710694.1 aspartate-alanine antiporter [Gilliamella sp. B3780]MCX8711694.1 aspartate-alanine antiporter [Gilliamella sp. B3468]MCX8715286.1 aspartate-alanine antiporter [Gilliamella sp. B3781]
MFQWLSHWILNGIQHSPEILLFLSLSLGYLIGAIRIGKFQLGGVAGSLLVAVALSVFGVTVDAGVKAVLFALFIYAVGFESGPQFFRSLGVKTLREIFLALFIAVAGLATVVVLAKVFNLDKGLAAGLAAGGLTQSAIMGTASDALSQLGLSVEELHKMQANVTIGYAVTYIFGSLGAIIICVNILPKIMGKDIADDAIKAQAEQLHGSLLLGSNQNLALSDITGRLYRVTNKIDQNVSEIEKTVNGISIEKIKRGNKIIEATPDTVIEVRDIILVVGHRDAMIQASDLLGTEINSVSGMDVVMNTQDVEMRNSRYVGENLTQVLSSEEVIQLKHGIYLIAIHRDGESLPLNNDIYLKLGDVITIYGSDGDLKRVVDKIGAPITRSEKTDWIFHGLGLVVGLIIGLIVIRVSDIPITLGAGGGALLSGLLFGWYRSIHQTVGNIPSGAIQLLKDFGLAGFVAVVGLSSGLQAINTIEEQGLSLFLIGVVVTVLPMLLAIYFGKYVLGYKNVAVFAGALAGARSANPAFGEVLNKAGNSTPTNSFAITYALANVFLTLLGPLVVAFV